MAPPIEVSSPSQWLQSTWILGPLAFLLWLTVLLVVRKVVIGSLQRVAARTPWSWDDVLVRAVSAPLLIAIVASGLVVLGRILPLSPEWDRAFDVLLAAGLVLAIILFADRASRGILDRLSARVPVLQGARGPIQGIVRAVVIGIGLLIFLDSIGISITPILASLGVGSLAVALALKDTLANLFAGIHLILDRPIEPGHQVRLEGGQEGTVTRVGWRSTWIRTADDNVVVVPNSTLAASVIINYSLPDTELAVTIAVGVHYDSDLVEVERVTLEVAREVMRSVEGGIPSFEPTVRYHTFGDSSIGFDILLRAGGFVRRRTVQHEFVKRLHDRYHREGIVIPYPIRTLDFQPMQAEALSEILPARCPTSSRAPDPES